MMTCDQIASVGRIGELVLDYVRNGHATILSTSRCRSPWHLFPPITLDDTGSAYTLLLNPSGGLVGGDRLSIRATLGDNAHVLLSTPSATRIYRSVAEPSVQSVALNVGPGAILEWMPDVNIPFAGSRFRQTIRVTLHAGATILLWDAMASGRVARGERWAFASVENEIRITTASCGYLLDRSHVMPDQKRGRGGFAHDWDYVASLYLVSDAMSAEVWKRLEEQIALTLDDHGGTILGGVSEPAVPGLVIKLVTRSAQDLNTVQEAIWRTIRAHLWETQVPALRRY
jgi:urease accessory protein